MANEVTLSASVEYNDGVRSTDASIASRQQTSAGKKFSEGILDVLVTETVIPKGDVTSLGAVWLKNLDPTNIITIKDAAAGHVIAVLDPDINADGKGGFYLVSKQGSAAQVPVAIATSATCRMEYLIISQ